MDPLSTMLSQWVGTVFSIRIWRKLGGASARVARQPVALVPNRGRDYEPDPVTAEQLRQEFGPGRYLVEVIEPAPPHGGLFEDPVERRYVVHAAMWVDA